MGFCQGLRHTNMRMSILEKAGLVDPLKVYDGLHVSEGFLRDLAQSPDKVDPVHRKEIEGHFEFCDQCLKEKESYLPIGSSDDK